MLLLPPERVLVLPRSFGYLTSMTRRKSEALAGLFCCCWGFLASNLTLSYWPNSLKVLGQTINVSIIECLTKKVGCGGIKNFMACHYSPPVTPASPHQGSYSPPPCCVSLPFQQEAAWHGAVSQELSTTAMPPVNCISFTGAFREVLANELSWKTRRKCGSRFWGFGFAWFAFLWSTPMNGLIFDQRY